MVFLLSSGSEVQEQCTAEPGDGGGFLEGHRNRPADLLVGDVKVHRTQEIPCVLQR